MTQNHQDRDFERILSQIEDLPALLAEDGQDQRAAGARIAIATLQTVAGDVDIAALKRSLFDLRQTLPPEQSEGVSLVAAVLDIAAKDDGDEGDGSGSGGSKGGSQDAGSGCVPAAVSASVVVDDKRREKLNLGFATSGISLPLSNPAPGLWLPRPFPPCGAFASRRKITKDDIDPDDYWSEKNRQRRAQAERQQQEDARHAAQLAALLAAATQNADEERPDEPSAAPR